MGIKRGLSSSCMVTNNKWCYGFFLLIMMTNTVCDHAYDYWWIASIYGGMQLHMYIVNLKGDHGWCLYDMMLIELMVPFYYDDL